MKSSQSGMGDIQLITDAPLPATNECAHFAQNQVVPRTPRPDMGRGLFCFLEEKMKLFLKKFTLILVSVITLLALFSCNSTGSQKNDDPSADSTTASQPSNVNLFSDGKTEYVILSSDDEEAAIEKQAATDLSQAFMAATGKPIKLTTDWERNDVSEFEICVGNVSRNGKYYNIDISSISENEFIVRTCDTRLILLGSNEYGTVKAVSWFIENYLSSADGSVKSISLPADFSYTGSFELSNVVRIMSQNLLATDTEYENNVKQPEWADRIKVDLSQHTLAARQPRMLDFFKQYAPDAIGVQECSASWRTYFNENLSKIGYERIGASKNGKIGIIYNTSRLKPITHNSFWLTEDPENLKISKIWGASSDGLTERLGMYVIFEVIETGERFIMFNTHIDTNKNNIIQSKQTGVLLDYIAKLQTEYPDLPVVMVGDFNYNMSSAQYKVLTSTNMVDTKKESMKSVGTGSFNKFIGQGYSALPIDQIVASNKGWILYNYRVLYDTVDGCFLSDHYAVIADMEIK